MIKCELLPYKHVGDIVYPMRPWYDSPFKCEKYGLSRVKLHWNFFLNVNKIGSRKNFWYIEKEVEDSIKEN